jgi:hypothetical protein
MNEEEFRVKERLRHKLYRLTHKKEDKAYRKRYNADPTHKANAKQYRLTHQKPIQDSRKKWKVKNPDKVRALHTDYEKRNRKKKSAQLMALRNVPLGKECELCPEDDKRTENLERHHPDYDYPLIIVTTCQECHEWVEVDKRGIQL